MIHDRLIALILRVIFFIFTLSGLIAVVNFPGRGFQPSILMYYTTQSNLLVFFLFGLLILRTAKAMRQNGRFGNTGFYPRFEMIVVVDILLTLVVFWGLLVPAALLAGANTQLFTFGNLAVHFITPVFCLIDYLLFTDSGHLEYKDVYLMIIFPVAYLFYSSIAGLMGYVYRVAPDGSPVRFPYFFYDFDRIGATALLYIGGILLLFLLLSHGLYLFDKRVEKPVLVPRK